MNQNESKFWESIREKFPGHVSRIENVGELGIPDVNACYKGFHFWAELKIDEGHGTILRNEQRVWHARRGLNSGVVLTISKNLQTGYIHIWVTSRNQEIEFSRHSKGQRIESMPFISCDIRTFEQTMLEVIRRLS